MEPWVSVLSWTESTCCLFVGTDRISGSSFSDPVLSSTLNIVTSLNHETLHHNLPPRPWNTRCVSWVSTAVFRRSTTFRLLCYCRRVCGCLTLEDKWLRHTSGGFRHKRWNQTARPRRCCVSDCELLRLCDSSCFLCVCFWARCPTARRSASGYSSNANETSRAGDFLPAGTGQTVPSY